MAKYLMKYKGTYRLKAAIDQSTNDYPRNENGGIDPSFDDIYIKCYGGAQIYHYGFSTLVAYIPSIGRGHNILKAIAKDVGLPEYKTYAELYKALEDEGTVRSIMENDKEIEFNCDMMDYIIGPKDMDLCQRLISAGPEHRKFMRQIFVSVTITAPLYWWKEYDTYKVGTVANSSSTMHKLASTPITLDCFETDDFDSEIEDPEEIINKCEHYRQKYLETKDKRYWKALVRWLPNGWLQTRTLSLNYENLRSMYFQRKSHKLTEWHQFCNWILTLPYAEDLIIYTKETKE